MSLLKIILIKKAPKQLQQVYKFIKTKEKSKKSKKKDDLENNYLISTLLMSPKHEIHSKLRDSLAAKAANKALLKWHSKMPLASLRDLEHIYNKFYEYYFDHLETFKAHNEEDEDGYLFEEANHLHRHNRINHHEDDSLIHSHNPHHQQNTHFNLLDFIKNKMDSDDSENGEEEDMSD